MMVLVDIGNTRTKWVVVDEITKEIALNLAHTLKINTCFNADISKSELAYLAKMALKFYIANVAGETMKASLVQLLGQNAVKAVFLSATDSACGLINGYENPNQLGVDRWLANLAAYHMVTADCLVVTAGTAITIDAITHSSQKATFIGGSITPGLQVMQTALKANTANLQGEGGTAVHFPTNTVDAIYTGAMLGAIGAIYQQWQNLYTVVKTPPKLIVSGGDAEIIAKNMQQDLAKHMIIVDNLVLRGIMLLERENA
jgi:type III pantothenate kinase